MTKAVRALVPRGAKAGVPIRALVAKPMKVTPPSTKVSPMRRRYA